MLNIAETNTKKPIIHFLQISVAVLLSLMIVACAPDVPSVTPNQAADLLAESKAVIIDVREIEEWDEQHIKGAMFIPLTQIKKHIGSLAKYKDSTVIVQCRSGRRSSLAAGTLISAGFSKIYNLEGGILAWNKQGLGTVRGRR